MFVELAFFCKVVVNLSHILALFVNLVLFRVIFSISYSFGVVLLSIQFSFALLCKFRTNLALFFVNSSVDLTLLERCSLEFSGCFANLAIL